MDGSEVESYIQGTNYKFLNEADRTTRLTEFSKIVQNTITGKKYSMKIIPLSASKIDSVHSYSLLDEIIRNVLNILDFRLINLKELNTAMKF